MTKIQFRLPGLFLLFCLLLISACKKEDAATEAPQPPAAIPDSTLKISGIVKVDAGAFEINYIAKPPVGEKYENLSVVYSTKADFSEVADSTVLFPSVTAEIGQKKLVDGLKHFGT